MIVYRELHSLEKDLGISRKTLYALSNSINHHYREARIPKTDGSERVLSVPDEALKRVQRAIADKLLAYESISVYAKAYKVGGGVRKNAVYHVGKEKLLKLDIHHFFDSIHYSTVKDKVFPSEKYAEPIRILLSLLCYRGDALPQGAPTSPVISNIIMREFDEEIGTWCRERGISYTRYCDDMTFSGSFDENEVTAKVVEALKPLGLLLNPKKTRCLAGDERKTVTGVVVNEKLNTTKEYRREIRQALYFCRRFGVAEHLRRKGDERSAHTYLQSLLGRVNYVLQITPDNAEFKAYKQELLALIKECH